MKPEFSSDAGHSGSGSSAKGVETTGPSHGSRPSSPFLGRNGAERARARRLRPAQQSLCASTVLASKARWRATPVGMTHPAGERRVGFDLFYAACLTCSFLCSLRYSIFKYRVASIQFSCISFAVAISNHRLLAFDGESVTFRWNGLRAWRQAENDDVVGDRVPTPLLSACAAQRVRSHPSFWISHQPASCKPARPLPDLAVL